MLQLLGPVSSGQFLRFRLNDTNKRCASCIGSAVQLREPGSTRRRLLRLLQTLSTSSLPSCACLRFSGDHRPSWQAERARGSFADFAPALRRGTWPGG
ncbi:hypothetical protein PsYK624_098670 [Phanerochaete sordida]|uniref:Uncharacterized protein n=1 Tax=Phanerochaete sordida TaxID=48140 RepID=A0A9P3GFA5_9APHY|nr:hypothetical protein PsYK624_098670 [Phanerochaete sordida]